MVDRFCMPSNMIVSVAPMNNNALKVCLFLFFLNYFNKALCKISHVNLKSYFMPVVNFLIKNDPTSK